MKREGKTVRILLTIISIPLFFFVFCPLVLYYYGHFTNSLKKAYETEWGILLPDQIKLVNDKRTTSFHGDGFRHTVYQINNSEDLKGFEVEKNQEIESFCNEIANKLAVESKYHPDFMQNYVWKEYAKYGDILVIIYFPDKKEIHLFKDSK